MSDVRPAKTTPRRYELAFLTDEWEWERALVADTMEDALAAAREALETVVREETPALACVTVVEDGVKLGVWDWIGGEAYWTRL